MWVPFKGSSKGMEDTDETGSVVFGFVQFVKHFHNNGLHRMEKTVEKRPVLLKIAAQLFGDCKNAVTVVAADQFSGHGSGTSSGIKVPAGRTEP